jgi:hypothetical protein
MAENSMGDRSRLRKLATILVVALALYGLAAYVVLPMAWTHYERQPGLADRPMVTRTGQGIPGDPLNVGLVGSHEDVVRAMHAAGWYPADPVTLRSSLEIVGSVAFDRPDHDAPVSPLYYDGRREDLAYEKPVGRSADTRDHVRFWKVLDKGAEGRPVWLGAATFDRGVGLSHDTGQVTHHIGPDIDAVRDLLADDLKTAAMVSATYQVSGIGPTINGHNGGGDPYYSDGEIWMMRLVPDGQKTDQAAVTLPPPVLVGWKDRLWHRFASWL